MKGHIQTEETRAKISRTLLGHSVSEDTKHRISIGRKGHVPINKGTWREGRVPWNKGLTKETSVGIQRISEAVKNLYKTGKLKRYNPKIYTKERNKKLSETKMGHIVSKRTKLKLRIARLNQKILSKDTTIELKMQEELEKRGIAFKKHVPLLGKYQVDILLPPNIVIECDGDYWHNRSKVKEKDVVRDRNLSSGGYTIFRFWEHEINGNVRFCIDKVEGIE